MSRFMLSGMRSAFLLALLLFLTAAAPVAVPGSFERCSPGPDLASCDPIDLGDVRLQQPETWLVHRVQVRPDALPLAIPRMVRIIALASSEVRWNGVVIGRNGTPGPDRAAEVPGLLIATFVVPPGLVRPGENIVSVRLSAHHLWLPVRTPVHAVEVIPYQASARPGGLVHYLPALLMLGALGAAFAYFATAAASDRGDRSAWLLAGIAASAALQLLVEVARALFAYTYPWHLARVSGIALLAALTACMIAAYSQRRFAPDWRWVVPLTALLSATGLVLLPWFDFKALAAILAGALALGLCAARGVSERRADAVAGVAAAFSFPILMGWQRTEFLDHAYYLLLAALLVLLVAEQVTILRRTRLDRDAEQERARALAERLSRAEREGEPILALQDGSRVHRVAENDILYIRAADDYCDVVLKDARALLVTTSLGHLLETLPERFVRVHRSYAVNRAHVVGAAARPGGGRHLLLGPGPKIPVGRAYRSSLGDWIG